MNLKKHQKTKREGVRYSCDLCEYNATQKGNLKKHQQSQHEGVRYQYQTTQRESLKVHQQSQHLLTAFPKRRTNIQKL